MSPECDNHISKCAGHDECFDRLSKKIDIVTSDIRLLNDRFTDVFVKLADGNGSFKMHDDRLSKLEKVVYSGVGLILTIVISTVMYGIIKR